MSTSTMSHKFQITIPKEVRAVKNLEAGDKIVFVNDGENVYLKKSTEV